MAEDTRRRIEEALQVLIGLPLWDWGRAADMAMFHLGAAQTLPARKGGSRIVGEYALHIQCTWRIVGPEGIVVARRDRFYRAGDEPRKDLDDFDEMPHGVNRSDERLDLFFNEVKDNPIYVEEVWADSVGSMSLLLSRGYALEVFPDDSLDGEHWRLFEPGNEDPNSHFVVTGNGIEDQDDEDSEDPEDDEG